MRIFLDTIGCRLNHSEIEQMAAQFRTAGHAIVALPGEADLVVINTCTVTNAASSDSRQRIRQAAHAGAERIIVTGCWATIDPRGAANLPSVSRVVENARKNRLVEEVLGQSYSERSNKILPREPLPGRNRRTRAFIKVQDGCNNHCAYCITRIARGAGKSRDLKEIFHDIKAAEYGGVKEIVLTGVNLGSWGQDFQEMKPLSDLIRHILCNTSIPRVRLSSIEPWDINDDFLDLIENPRFCKHLHLPLQSGSKQTLKHMARQITPDGFALIVDRLRAKDPGLAITTDIMVGFPGETIEEFNESLEFVERMQFSRGHVFQYSPRPGTVAANMPFQIPPDVKQHRSAIIRGVVSKSQLSYEQSFIGAVVKVLWEKAVQTESGLWLLDGLSGNYLKIRSVSSINMWNKLSEVKVLRQDKRYLIGEIIDD
ncbi:MAG TPA: tRNA (N(6)-L-threonylcarbamoyladenosine(37)-C(2))-methylthiotransferase MtaB [Anaerolineae bacterium]|nr:tRNA (N(6)-L-threonylcarbamoyladenosine(37)-C(2))-methylthiotransferase MtaB [Anaerolineae bacterium]